MNIKLPEKFYFKEPSGDNAVLLLHGFTGNTSDVRQLGRYLQKKGMTSYSINYEGHAEHPKKITESSPLVWFKQVVEAYDFLRDEGYSNIFVAGVSIGGVMALGLAAGARWLQAVASSKHRAVFFSIGAKLLQRERGKNAAWALTRQHQRVAFSCSRL